MRIPALLLVAMLLSAAAPARAEAAANCSLVDDLPSPYRTHGSARVRVHGDGFSWDLPAQPAVCGAAAIQNMNDFSKVRAGDGFLFQTCVPEGVIEVFSNAPGPVPTSRDQLFAHSSILFATTNTPHPQTYGLTKPGLGDRLAVNPSRRSASLAGTLRLAHSDAKVEVDVSFDCTHGPPIASGPLAESSPAPRPLPAPVSNPSPAAPRPKPDASNCNMTYRIGETPRENRLTVDSLQTCEAVVQTDSLSQCRSHPGSELVSGMFRFRSGANWEPQIFSTTCARREARAPLCLTFPCLHELANAPGCQPCTGGMTRNAECECTYPRGATYCEVGGRTSFTDQSNFAVDDSSFAACRARVEQDVLRRCQSDARGAAQTGWAELTINFFDHGAYSQHNYVVDCRDLMAGNGLCSGESCPRPCPKGQCLSQGKCVVPGGPIAGLCDGPIYCEICK